MNAPAQYVVSITVSGLLLVVGLVFAFNKSWEGVIGTLFIAVIALHFATYKLWARERTQVVNLDERLTPKLKCSFGKHIPGCEVWTPMFAGGREVDQGKYFRICVETQGVAQVNDCQGTLTSLKRDGLTLFENQSLGLHVANAESNPRSKHIRDKVPEFIDVFVYFKNANQIAISTPGFEHPGSIQHATLFTGAGEYLFSVVVSSRDSPSGPIAIELNWTGDIDTSTAREISQ
jgi:hypothetical protein